MSTTTTYLGHTTITASTSEQHPSITGHTQCHTLPALLVPLFLSTLPSLLPSRPPYLHHSTSPTSHFIYLTFSDYSTPITLFLHLTQSGPSTILLETVTPAVATEFSTPEFLQEIATYQTQYADGTALVLTGSIALSPDLHETTALSFTLTPPTPPPLTKGTGARASTGTFPSLTAVKTIGAVTQRPLGLAKKPPATGALTARQTASILQNFITAVLTTVRNNFARDDEIDELNARHFIETTIPTTAPLAAWERDNVEVAVGYKDMGVTWRRIPNTVTATVEYYIPNTSTTTTAADSPMPVGSMSSSAIRNSSMSWGKAICSVDASPSSVVAYLWLLSSNCRINRHYHGSHHSLRHRTNSPLRAHTPIPDSHSATFVNVAALPKPLTDRVFKTVFTWHFIPPHAYAIAFHPTTDTAAAQIVADDKRASKFIVGEIKGCWYVTRPSSAANTSTLTYIVHGSLNGNIPTAMFKRQVKSTLNECLEVQSRFLRSSTTIDVELRAAFPPPPRLADLTQQQMQVIIGCKLLESQSTLPQSPSNTSRSLFRRPSVAPPPAADAVNQFQPIPSPSPFVQMALKNSTNPTRAIALGRAVAKIDTSPLLAIAYWNEYCSRYRNRTSREELNPARIAVLMREPHDITFATVKAMPFPLRRREFVFRCVAATDDNGDYIHATSPDSTVTPDYGFSRKNIVPGVVRMFVRFVGVPGEEGSCKVALYQYLDAGGHVPAYVVNTTIPSALGALTELRELFQRDEEVDLREREGRAERMSREQVYTLEERETLDDCRARLQQIDNLPFSPLTSPDPSVTMSVSMKKTADATGGVIRATTVCDNTMENCAAFETALKDRWHMKESYQNKEVERTVTEASDHSSVLQMILNLDIPGLANREFVLQNLWERTPETIFVTQESADLPEFPRRRKYVRATVTAYWLYTKLPSKFSFPQTQVTYTMSIDLHGILPSWVPQLLAVDELMYLSRIRVALDKTVEIDERGRDICLAALEAPPSPYTTQERTLLAYAAAQFTTFDTGKKKPIKLDSPLIQAELSSSSPSGWASTEIKTAPKQVLAYLWEFSGTEHSHADSDNNSTSCWSATDDSFNTYTLVQTSPPAIFKISPASNIATTRLQILAPPKSLSRLATVQEYFLARSAFASWDADDGACLGEVLVLKHKLKWSEDLYSQSLGLKQLVAKHEFFKPMMTRVLKNMLRSATVVNTKLCDVSAMEGTMIGGGLALSMATNLTAEAGVDEWILNFDALTSLDREYVWFRPMLNAIGKRLLGEVSWGLKLRIMSGAVLSIVDMTTDVVMVVVYLKESETRVYGWVLLVMLCTSLLLQLCMTCLKFNRKKPLQTLKEALVVVVGMKPVLDVYNIIGDVEEDEDAILDPMMELTATKYIETFSETLPGCVLQCYVLMKQFQLTKERVSRVALGSILMSACCAGFVSATLSFDVDVSPQKRKETPGYYGYIPDGRERLWIFSCMLLNGALMLLIRSVTAALLMLVGKKYFMFYLGIDNVFYLLVKAARGDLTCWLQAGPFVQLLYRIVVKFVSDFLASLDTRHPGEIGGLHFTLNMVFALAAGLTSVAFCVKKSDWGGYELYLWNLMGGMSSGWVLTFGAILALMKKEYRVTFYSTKTGKEVVMERFESEDEAIKMTIFKKNHKLWAGIRGEVKQFVESNWFAWKESKPKWFTEGLIARIPPEFVPSEADRIKLESIRKEKREDRRKRGTKERRKSTGPKHFFEANQVVPINK